MTIPLYYEIPLLISIVLAVYAIYHLITIITSWHHDHYKESYLWLIYAVTFFIAWSIDHLFHDLYPLPEDLILFFHYVISHGFLLLSITCIAVSAQKTKKIHLALAKAAKKGPKKKK